MSELQQKAMRLISGLSDDNISFLIEVIQRLMPQEADTTILCSEQESTAIQAFQRLDAARPEVKRYLSDDFDPEKELEEARVERYGSTDRYKCDIIPGCAFGENAEMKPRPGAGHVLSA